jgi:hypothetical protein
MRYKNGIGAVALAAAVAIGASVSPVAAQEPETGMDPTVELTIATSVENGEPVGEAERFPADVGELVAYLDIVGAEGETLNVVWSHQGNEVKEDLKVESTPSAQWTAMAIPEQATGEWTVEVRHGDAVLTSSTFTIGVQ